MKIAICCPGQSLVRRWSERTIEYDTTIAVNAAAKVVSSDWVCAPDKVWYRGLFGDDLKQPRHGFLVAPDAYDDAKRFILRYNDPLAILTWENIALIHQHTKEGRPINWGVQSALCFAEQLGATAITLYGADGRKSISTIDASGYKGEDRTAERWEREENDIAYTFAMIRSRGTTIERIDP
jgi:hypothetical protein